MKTLARGVASSVALFAVSASVACGGEAQPATSAQAAAAENASASSLATPADAAPPLLVVADAGAPAAADPEIAALIANGLASKDAYAITGSLSDEVGSRIVGSPGFLAAVKWGEKKMTALGLSNVHLEPVKVERWERGEESGSIVAPAPQKLDLTALGLSPATPAAGVEAEVVEVASLAALDALDASMVKGKIVFFNKEMQRTHDGSGYGHGVDIRVLGGLAAAKKGAIAALVRSVTASHDRAPHTGSMRLVAEKGSKYDGVKAVPSAALSVPDAELVHRLIAAGSPVRVQMKLASKVPPPVMTNNVVGEIPGTTDASHVIVFGAHLDSWDLGTGAQDDGAGCGIILGAARLLLANHIAPARTIRVILYAGEEYGELGAKAYAAAHTADAGNIVSATEADEGSARVLGWRVLGDRSVSAPTLDALSRNLAALDIKALDQPGHGGSDTSFLLPLGVPMFDLQQDMSPYFDIHHSRNDVMDQIDPATIAQASTAYAVLATVLGRPGATLGRVPADQRMDK